MIEGSGCECGKKIVPFRKICPVCGKKMKKLNFEEKGTIVTHTTLYAVPEGFVGPLKLVMVKLDGNAHLICGFKGKGDLSIGDNVKIIKKGELHFCEIIK